MVWTSMSLAVPYISQSWIYEPTGETIYWKANEHAVVIIGYTEDKVIISDPIDGKAKYQSKYITIMERRRYITNEKEESKQNITTYHHNNNPNNI